MEEFQMILVEFGTKTVDFGVFGEDRNRDNLPFQMPLKVYLVPHCLVKQNFGRNIYNVEK